jgi:hypothetical protein
VTDSLHKYTITVDSTQASAAITSVEGALKRSESAAVSAGLALDKAFVVESKSITKADLAIHNLEESLKKFNLEAQRVEDTLPSVTNKATDWGKAANALKERTEKGAAAMAILAQTMGNTESAGGKLIAGAGTMAAAYGAGGPWMVALIAGAGTIEWYTKKQYELLAAEEKIFENRADLVAQQHALTDALGAASREAADAVTLLSVPEKAREAARIGMEQSRIDAEIRAKLNIAERNHQDDVAKILRGNLKTNAETTLQKLTALNLTKDQKKAEEDNLKIVQRMADLQKQQGEDALKAARAAFPEAKDTNAISGVMKSTPAADRATAEAEKIVDAERKKMEDIAKLSDKAMEDLRKDEELKQKYAERAQEKILDGEKAMRAQMEQMAIGSYGIIAGASQQLVADLITGQDHAVEHFATSIMAQAGQSLIASSVKLAGEATVSAFTPGLQPLAIAQGSAAAGLFAGGLALGGLAVGAEHVMAGGAIGQKLPDQKSGTPMGFGGRSSSGGSQGSGTNITIVYSGASGPSADDGARAVTMALTLAQRRGQYNNNLDRRF